MYFPSRPLLRQIWHWRSLLVLLLLAVLWGGVLLDLQRAYEAVHARAADNLTNLTLAYAKDTESAIKTIDVTLIHLREHWRGNARAFHQAIDQRQAHLKDELILQVSIVDAQGTLRFSSLENPTRPIDLSDRRHIRIHQERQSDTLYISSPIKGRVSGRWTLQFTRPIFTPDGAFAGVIVISVSPEYFQRFHQAVNLPGGSVVSLQQQNGEVLARYPNPDRAIGKSIVEAPFRAADAPESGLFRKTAEIDGITRMYAWRKLPRHDLVVVLGHAVEHIEAVYAEQRGRALLAAGGLSLLIILIGMLRLRVLHQREQAERLLGENEQRWRYALEAAGDGVWDWQLESGRVIFSDRWKSMLGYAPDEISAHLDEWKQRVHPEDMPRIEADLNAHLSGETPFYRNEHRMLDRRGQWVWILDRGMVLERDAQGRPLRMVGTHTDISERKAMEERLKLLATSDPLTGLANRRHFLERLREEWARTQRYPDAVSCVLMADLDHFKQVNDRFGHAAGDLALQEFARILEQTSRETDLCGRLGGEEFAVLLPQTNGTEALLFAHRLGKRLRENVLVIDDQPLRMTVSLGISPMRPGDRHPEEALQRADAALYQAKHDGRDRAALAP